MVNQELKQSVSELPFELVEEILTRVSVGDLVRFRCVCRKWRSLIQDKEFIRRHITYAPRKFLWLSFRVNTLPRRIIYDRDGIGKPKMRSEELHLSVGDGDGISLDVIGHCNGLLCVQFPDRSLSVWNPCLRELRRVPTSIPMNISLLIGFGYDNTTDDYKIILLPPVLGTDHQAEIFTLSSGSRMINFPYTLDPRMSLFCDPGTLLGRDIFWIVFSDSGTESILSFDLVSETFKDMPSPPPRIPDESYVFRRLVVIKGCLAVADSQMYGSPNKIVVWSQGGDEVDVETWRKMFTVTSPGSEIERCWMLNNVESKEAELLVRAEKEREGYGKLFAWNIEERIWREVETDWCPDDNESSLRFCSSSDPRDMYEYIETLVSPFWGL